MNTRLSAVALLFLGAAWPVTAGEIETVQFDITSLPLSIFGVQFTADYLGPPAGEIIDTTVHLTYQGDGTPDAADLIISFQAPSQGVPVWELTGADLGWQGAGSFEATVGTDVLNGLIDLGDPPPDFSLFFLQIQAVGFQPLDGQFSNSFFRVRILTGSNPADLNGDLEVNAADLALLLGNWGPCVDCAADLNHDAVVDAADLAMLLGNWGPCG